MSSVVSKAAGMSENAPRDDDDEDESDRGSTNIVIAAFVALVIAVGIWLVNALLEQRRLDDCAAQGRRNCAPVSVPADGR